MKGTGSTEGAPRGIEEHWELGALKETEKALEHWEGTGGTGRILGALKSTGGHWEHGGLERRWEVKVLGVLGGTGGALKETEKVWGHWEGTEAMRGIEGHWECWGGHWGALGGIGGHWGALKETEKALEH